MDNFLAKMISVGRYKLLVILFTVLISAAGYFLWQNTHKKPENSQTEQPNQQLRKWRTPEEIKPSYAYEALYSQLSSQGVSLFPLENHEILSQIFPKSKIWKFTSKEGYTSYLADGEDKIERNVINDQALTDKLVGFNSLETDFDGDRERGLIAFTIINFKDVALCCNEKRFLNIFKKNKERKWTLLKEKELEVYHGGKHTGKIRIIPLEGFSVIEIIIDGYYYNGLKTSTVEWYIWQGKDFKQIWREHLFYNTDNVGTYPQEARENYQASFELEPEEDSEYPKIKLVKTYTKKQGKTLKNAKQEEIYYRWNEDKREFTMFVKHFE